MMIIDQEKLVDNVIIEGIIKDYPELKKLIETCSPYEIRGKILSVLDPRNDLHYDYREFNEMNLESEDLEYLDEIVTTLRNYVRVADTEVKSFGEVMTPIPLVEDMLNTFPSEVWSNPNLKWFDPCAGVGTFQSVIVQRLMKGLKKAIPNKNKRYRHIIENMIYVCELQAKNMFIFHCIFDRPNVFELNTFYGSFLTDEFNEHMTNVWGVEKFDIIIGNPPYNQNIDLKFLKKSHDISDVVLFVHPSVWVLDNKMKNQTFLDCRSYVKDRIKSLTLFNGNGIFDIGLFYPCMFTYITKDITDTINVVNKLSGNNYSTNNINEIDLYDCNKTYLNLKDKIKNYISKNTHLWFMCKRDYNGTHTFNTQSFEVGISPMRGNHTNKETKMYKDDFFTFLQKQNPEEHIGVTTQYKLKFGFDTIQECNNFITYLKSDFARFCLSIYKTAQTFHGGELEIVPYLDFTQEWTDEKLYKEFKLTEEEINFISTQMPKFY
jgi:hypothetical protein